jgi:transcriptional regulator with XRE-family HTH domain
MTTKSPTDIMTPEEIRALRKRVGLNQTDFGDVVGVSQMTVSDWENGAMRPSEPRAAAMYQWRKRLDQMSSKEEEADWTRKLLKAAAQAGIVAVLLRLFGAR